MTVPEIVVCLKVVPRPEEVRINPETLTLDRTNVRSLINPADMHALEVALALKDRYGGRVRLLSMGPPTFEPYLRIALAMGADEAYLLSDRAFGGADTLATSYTLASGIRKIGHVDVVICGEESTDGATAQVPAGIAEWLGFSQVTYASDVALVDSRSRLWARRNLGSGAETLTTSLPVVLSVPPHVNEPRFIDMGRRPWAEDAPLTVWDVADLEVDSGWVGVAGSATVVAGTHEAETRERRRERIAGTTAEQAHAVVERLRPLIEALGATRPAPIPRRGEQVRGPALLASAPAASTSHHVGRRDRAEPRTVADGEWAGRATLVDADQTVQAQILARLWTGPVDAAGTITHWGGILRTEDGGGHLPFEGEYFLRLDGAGEARITEHGPVVHYAERGLSGEQVEVRGVGAPPF